MAITPKNLIQHELIGLKAQVLESSNKSQQGIEGLVVDETKNLIAIETPGGIKRIQKKDASFIFVLPGHEKVKVSGNRLLARPEERVKLKVRKW